MSDRSVGSLSPAERRCGGAYSAGAIAPQKPHAVKREREAASAFHRTPRGEALAVPAPGGGENAVEVGVPRSPAEQRAGARSVGDERRRIAGPARRLAPRDAPAGDAFGGGDDLAHRMALPGG